MLYHPNLASLINSVVMYAQSHTSMLAFDVIVQSYSPLRSLRYSQPSRPNELRNTLVFRYVCMQNTMQF